MGLQDLSGGRNFKMSGPGSFGRKLNNATVRGSLQNLRDNRESIVKALGDYTSYIRRGQFGRLSQRKVMEKIKTAEGAKLTIDDKRDIKAVLKTLGEGEQNAALKAKEEQAAETIKAAHAEEAAKQSEGVEAKKARAEKIIQEASNISGTGSSDQAGTKPEAKSAFKPIARINRAPGEAPGIEHLATAFDRSNIARRVDKVNRSATVGQALKGQGTGLAGNRAGGSDDRTGLAGNYRPGIKTDGPTTPPPPRTRIPLSV